MKFLGLLFAFLLLIEGPINITIASFGIVASIPPLHMSNDSDWWPCKYHNCGCTKESCRTNCCCYQPKKPSCCASKSASEEKVDRRQIDFLPSLACKTKKTKDKIFEAPVRLFLSITLADIPKPSNETSFSLIQSTALNLFVSQIFRPPKPAQSPNLT